MLLRNVVRPHAYHDSVTLMLISRDLNALPGVALASAMMGTEHNRRLLEEAGLLTPEGKAASPNDLVIAVRADSEASLAAALGLAEERLTARQQARAAAGAYLPRTLDSALRLMPGANLALISVPGLYAQAEAHRALRRGLHVFLFSDNVPLAAEVELKQEAVRAGLLLMGPDCGTALINGAPLGFVNRVPRGSIGLVAAAGTGLQEVMSLAARLGGGISQAIGVGGRDLSEEVGGAMMAEGLRALAADPATAAVVLISKPPASSAIRRLLPLIRACPKPVVATFLGGDPSTLAGTGAHFARSLEEAAGAAVALAQGKAPSLLGPFTLGREAVAALVAREAARLGETQRDVRGLYAGGTLAAEAALLLGDRAAALQVPHAVLDLGDDRFTVGRPHPMIDGSLRRERLLQEARDPRTAVILFDLVLGDGAHPDPAGDLAPALAEARAIVRAQGRDLALVATICGTEADPQDYARQQAVLEGAGAVVMPSNAQAARLAALIASRGHGLDQLYATPTRPGGMAATPPDRSAAADLQREPPAAAGGPEPPAGALPLFGQAVRAVNLGLEGFAEVLRAHDVEVVHVDWSPPAGGDPHLAALLARLQD